MTPRGRRGGGEGPLPRRILWTDAALADLDAIAGFIGRDDPAAAERWIDTLLAGAEKAARLPMTGRQVPELDRADVREVLVRAYRIVYWVQDEHIELLTICEGHRPLPIGRIAP